MNKTAGDKISLKLALKVFQHIGKTIVNFEPEHVNFVLPALVLFKSINNSQFFKYQFNKQVEYVKSNFKR